MCIAHIAHIPGVARLEISRDRKEWVSPFVFSFVFCGRSKFDRSMASSVNGIKRVRSNIRFDERVFVVVLAGTGYRDCSGLCFRVTENSTGV